LGGFLKLHEHLDNGKFLSSVLPAFGFRIAAQPSTESSSRR